MEISDFIVRTCGGKITKLDREYRNLLDEIILTKNEENYERWETYNLIIKELLNIDSGKYFIEIKYRLTDKENPNIVFLDILTRYDESEFSHLLWFLKKKVEFYEDEDLLKRFL